MKTYKIDYEMSGTITDFCRAWVRAESKEQAIQYLKSLDWDQIEDTEVLDTQYDDDYDSVEIEDVIEENDN